LEGLLALGGELTLKALSLFFNEEEFFLIFQYLDIDFYQLLSELSLSFAGRLSWRI